MLGPLTYGILSSAAATPAPWTPATPTTGGGVSPHTWLVPDVANFQDPALTTPAVVTDPVGGVDNQGSDNYAVVQGTGANCPTLQQVTINTVTSYVWRHDGTNDFLQGAFGGGAISQPFTVFAVGKLAAGAASDGVGRALMDADDTSNRMLLNKNTANNFIVNSGATLTDGAANENWNIWTVLFNGASSQLWFNGVSAVTGNAGAQTPNGIAVGAVPGVTFWKGDIGQILIYPGNISTADKNQVGEYLESVTGIVWTTIT